MSTEVTANDPAEALKIQEALLRVEAQVSRALLQPRIITSVPAVSSTDLHVQRGLALFQEGGVLYTAGDVGGALAKYEASVQEDPALWVSHSNIAVLSLADKDNARALNEFRVAASGTGPDAIAIGAVTHTNYGLSLLPADPRGAIREFVSALGCPPFGDHPPRRTAADINVCIAFAFLIMGDGGHATKAISAAVDADPSDPGIHLAQSSLSLLNNDIDGAVAEYQQYPNPTPAMQKNFQGILRLQSSQRHFAKGNRYSNADDEADAASEFRQALSLRPADAATHYNLGNAYARLGQFASAVPQYRSAIRERPKNVEDYLGLSAVLLALGGDTNVAEAAKISTTAVRLDPQSANAHRNLGAVYTAQNRYKKALKEITEAARLRPDLPGIDAQLAGARAGAAGFPVSSTIVIRRGGPAR